MKKIIFCTLFMQTAALFSAAVTGKTLIVKDNLVNFPENDAHRIMAGILGKKFNTKMKVIDIKNYNGKDPAIILRPVRAGLDKEEWRISAKGNTILIEGGRPVGVLYGTYEFLEEFGKCHFYAPDCLHVPRERSFTVPDGKVFQRKPAYKRRLLYALRNNRVAEYQSWNKLNAGFVALKEDKIPLPQEYQYKTQRQLGSNSHSFHFWSKEFPKDKPEYFSLGTDGKRWRSKSPMGPGQICLSHPEVRKLIKAKVLRVIAKDRADAVKFDFPPAPTVNITHNDNGSYCVCPGCLALLKKYGQYSGVLLDFINDVASCAPDMIFETFAYTFTEEPPKGIKPAKNVSMYLAFLGPELMNGKCDTLRPFSHPNNATIRRFFRQWSGLCDKLSIWLYQRQFRQVFPSPNARVSSLGEDFRYMRKFGATGINAEAEYDDLGNIGPRSFHALHNYISVKMMDNPYRNEKLLIADFIKNYYGPAAPEMTQFLTYLEKRMNEEKGMLGKTSEANRAYMDTDFLVTINSLLVKALAKTVKGSPEYKRTAMEFVPLDFAIANMWEKLPDLEKRLGMTKKQVLARLKQHGTTAHKLIFDQPDQKKVLQRFLNLLNDKIKILSAPLPVPPELANRTIIQHAIAALNMDATINDPEAVGGKAAYLGPKGAHNKPIEAGIYLRYNKKHLLMWRLDRKFVPQDEKYHLYCIGRTTLPPTEMTPALWAHWSWSLRLNASINAAYSRVDSSRIYDVLLSLKLTGPAYVKGSKKPNGFYVDQIIYVRKDDPLPMPAELKGRKGFVFDIAKENAGKFSVAPDMTSPAFRAIEIPAGKAPMEFGFYFYRNKKVIFRKKFAPGEIKKDGKYHLYSLGVHAVPSVKDKAVFWGHESWNIKLTNFFNEVREKSSPNAKYEIFVSLKSVDGKLYFNRVIFAAPTK